MLGGRSSTLQEPFASNPFRVLQLPANASGSQIRQTIERVRIEARLSSNPDLESRIDVLTKAQSELLDPLKRIQHEALWFYNPPDCLYDGSLEETDQALARFRADVEPEKSWQSAHDLALWLLVEASHNSDPKSAEDWTVRALSAWSEIIRDPFYIRQVSGSNKSHKEAATASWALGVEVLAGSAHRYMNGGAVNGVLSLYRGAKSYGVERTDLLKIVGPAIEIGVLEGQRLIAEADTVSDEIKNEPREALAWAERLERSLSGQLDLQEEVENLGAPELEKVLGEAAALIRSVSISLHNDLSATLVALKLLKIVQGLAVSEADKKRYRGDERQLQYQAHLTKCTSFVRVGRWIEAEKSAKAALSYADSPEERRYTNETISAIRRALGRQNREASGGDVNWRGLIWLAGIVGALIIFGIIFQSFDSGSGGTQSNSTVNTPSKTSSFSTNACQSKDTDLDVRLTNLNSLKSTLDTLESQYPGGTAPSDVVDRYNDALAKVQRLGAQYNNLVQAYNEECVR